MTFYDDVCLILAKELPPLESINMIIDLCNEIEQLKAEEISREEEYKNKRLEEEKMLKDKNLCRFDIWYGGRCKKPGYPYCSDHLKHKCSCGAQATHDNNGEPLCDNHLGRW